MSGIIGIPNYGLLNTEFVASLIGIKGEVARIEFLKSSAVHLGREMIVDKCLADPNCEYILFVDSDMVLPSNILTQLLSHNLPIVSAMCFKSKEPFEPCFYEAVGENLVRPYEFNEVPKGLFEVEAVGMAAVLIRREVFEKIHKPCFTPFDYMGEDISFCIRAKQAGFPIYIDPSLIVGHLGYRTCDVFSYLENKQRFDDLVGGAV